MNYLNILRELELEGWDISIYNKNSEWYLNLRDSKLEVNLKTFRGTLEVIIRQAYLYVNKVER